MFELRDGIFQKTLHAAARHAADTINPAGARHTGGLRHRYQR